MRFGVLPDFGKTCRLRAHLWASKLTDFLDICNTIFFSSLSSSRAIRFSCLFATGIARHYTLFNLARHSAFSIFFSDTKRWQLFFLFRPFISRLRTCTLSLFFGPQNLIPPHLTFYFSDTIRYHGPHLKKCLCVYLFSFLLFLVIYRRFGIDGTEYWLGWADTKI